ncbi:MAG: ribbon-helix-helix protein, CopG family [Chitinivibrionales bacterium]|nr:ribbon-helix-helix protein, CopG family [Chitinivibrionales bacterium]
MVRTQIYLTEEEKAGLESAALAQGKRQSVIIRKAIDDLLAHQATANKTEILNEIAGIWADRKDVPNIRAMRAGWRRRPVR